MELDSDDEEDCEDEEDEEEELDEEEDDELEELGVPPVTKLMTIEVMYMTPRSLNKRK